MRVLHVITTLSLGGAEILMERFLASEDRDLYQSEVVVLGASEPVGGRIERAGVPVTRLGMRPSRVTPGEVARLVRCVRDRQPQVVHSWMYHADLLGGLAARAARVPSVWSVHQSDLTKGIRMSTRGIARLNAALSYVVPAAVVCTSEASLHTHRQLGYRRDRLQVIRNGFPTYQPQPAARETLRRELGVAAETLLVGRVGRWHPQKDYPMLLQAAAVVRHGRPEVHFVLVGPGIEAGNTELMAEIRRHGLVDGVHLLGPRTDVEQLHAAFDVEVSSSAFGETFPLVLGEALSCGVPVVATDVGDVRALVGDAGTVVARRSPAALAHAVLVLVDLDPPARRAIGARGRQRVRQEFALATMVQRYHDLYRDVAARSDGE